MRSYMPTGFITRSFNSFTTRMPRRRGVTGHQETLVGLELKGDCSCSEELLPLFMVF